MSQFLASLRTGKVGEDAVKRVLGDAFGWKANDSKRKKDLAQWDVRFTLDGEDRYGEVKYDRMQAKTRNVAIEYWNPKSNKPSGLMATTAEVWFLVLADPLTVWAASVERLKEYCRENRPERIVEKGGDQNASLMLFPTDPLLAAVFVELTAATPERVAELLRSVLA